jgi:hydrogenase expression/formation protein HypC
MCLGIPMEVLTVDGYLARCSAQGVEREVNLFMMQDDEPVVPGDFVMVHVGYAIQKLFDEMLRAEGPDADA